MILTFIDSEWANKPSASAKFITTFPLFFKALFGDSMIEYETKKSFTDKALLNRDCPDVGKVWLGPAQ